MKKQRTVQCTEAGVERLRVALSKDVVIMPAVVAVGLHKLCWLWIVMTDRETWIPSTGNLKVLQKHGIGNKCFNLCNIILVFLFVDSTFIADVRNWTKYNFGFTGVLDKCRKPGTLKHCTYGSCIALFGAMMYASLMPLLGISVHYYSHWHMK
jgi:hypothetical protein